MGCCAKGRIQNKGCDDAVLLFAPEVTLWRGTDRLKYVQQKTTIMVRGWRTCHTEND